MIYIEVSLGNQLRQKQDAEPDGTALLLRRGRLRFIQNLFIFTPCAFKAPANVYKKYASNTPFLSL